MVDQPLTPARGEGRGRAAEEPRPRLGRQGVHDHERVHPAAMGRPDQQVAASREVLPAGRPDPEPEDHEDHEPRHQAQQPIGPGRLRLGRPSEPREALGRAAARGGQRLGRDPAGRGPAAARSGRPARARSSAGGRLGLRLVSGSSARVVVRRRPRASSVASSSARGLPPRPRRGCRSPRRRRSRRPSRPGRPAARSPPRSPRPGRSAGRHRSSGRGAASIRMTMAGITNASETTCAVGTPKNVQLSWRSVSRTKRVSPYQTKKPSSRSPGRSRLRRW